MAASRSLPELAHIISSRTNSIYDALNADDLPQPSFDSGAPLHVGPLSRSAGYIRAQLLEAIDELRALIIGPTTHVFFMSFMGPAWTATLHVLYKFEIAKHVPLTGSVSYKDLAGRCGLSESFTKRYVRAAISLRIFCEPATGFVQHNAASAALATTTLHEWLGMATEEIALGATKVAESMLKYPNGEEPAQAAFALANGSQGDKDLFTIVSDSPPERMERFAKAMAWSMKVPGMEPEYTVNSLGWSDPKKCPKLVVDVGGGTGSLCKAILQKYPGVERAVVQELPEVAAQGEADIRGDLKGRLEFQVHSFFSPQTLSADFYIWRCVLHDWPDGYAVRILQNQIPALKPGARILLNERCLEPPKRLSHAMDQFARSCDILMGICANGKERTREEWSALLARADRRFKLASVTTPPHSVLSIIEVVWTGGETNGSHVLETQSNGNHLPDFQINDGRIIGNHENDGSWNGNCINGDDTKYGAVYDIDINGVTPRKLTQKGMIKDQQKMARFAEGNAGGAVGSTIIGEQEASLPLHRRDLDGSVEEEAAATYTASALEGLQQGASGSNEIGGAVGGTCQEVNGNGTRTNGHMAHTSPPEVVPGLWPHGI